MFFLFLLLIGVGEWRGINLMSPFVAMLQGDDEVIYLLQCVIIIRSFSFTVWCEKIDWSLWGGGEEEKIRKSRIYDKIKTLFWDTSSKGEVEGGCVLYERIEGGWETIPHMTRLLSMRYFKWLFCLFIEFLPKSEISRNDQIAFIFLEKL